MERKNSGIDALADWLRNVINEEGLPVLKPLPRSLPPEMLIYGLCGLWRNTAPYRIFEFLNAQMTCACFVCNEVIRGEYSCDFWLGNGDYEGTYYVGFVCGRCWNDAPVYGDKHNEYAESFFLPFIADLPPAGYDNRIVSKRIGETPGIYFRPASYVRNSPNKELKQK
jgi:hypothetical protein